VPVDKLFWRNPYLTRCDAVVTGVDGTEVTLDRAVAFAFSGGQASDVGVVGGREILSAQTRGPEIVYTLPADHGLRLGDSVVVEIDWPTRANLMRLHFAAELVLELATRQLRDAEKIGANISADKARVDFAMAGTIADALPEIASGVARIVAQDLAIVSAFSDEVAQRRYWEIDGFARVACGGTHPRRTGEVSAVTLKRANPGAGKERIEIRLVEPTL
jgi:Ser-tRNA(Ala) deacylase AlaX